MLGNAGANLGGRLYHQDIKCLGESRSCYSDQLGSDDSKLFCCRCAHKRRASPLTCLAICFLVFTYNLLGGFLFLAIEGSAVAEETAVAASKPNLSTSPAGNDLRSNTVERLWSITEDLNILYKENWTKLAAKELMDFQRVLIKSLRGGALPEGRVSPARTPQYRWTFASSFLYALTLITTIGHGNVTPKSTVGKMVAIAYACVGIPIIMVYLSTIGEALARNCRVLYSRVCPASVMRRGDCETGGRDKSRSTRQDRTPFQAALNLDRLHVGSQWSCRQHVRVPPSLSLLLLLLYVALGALVFHSTEQWTLADSCYFSFSSLATIGLGDLRPGEHAGSARADDLSIGVCCLYILVGIVIVAMCFNLIQEDVGSVLRGKFRVVHSAEPADASALS